MNDSELKIIPGKASQLLAARIAAQLGCEVALCEFKRFPDGELYTRIIDDIEGKHAVIVQSLIADSDLIALLQLIDAAADEASRLSAVIPYLGYARQDKKFKHGEAVSIRAIAKCICASTALDSIFVVNVHDPHELRYFEVKPEELDASAIIGDYITEMGIDPVVIGPDGGAEDLARSVAVPHGFDYDVLQKKRLAGDLVEIKPKELNVSGRNIVIVDDIISTGGTIAEASRILREQGAREVYVFCVHGLFVQNAIMRLHHAGIKEVVSTDTVESAFSRVSVAELIANSLSSLK